MGNKSNYSLMKLMPVMFSFFVMGFVDVVGVSVSYAKDDFGLSDTMSNLLPMFVFIWFFICSLPIGVMMSKIGRKRTVLISAVVTSVGLLIPLVNYSFPSLLVAFALLGIGNTILQVSLNPLVTNVCRADKITSMLTFGQFIKAIASTLGPILLTFAAATFGSWKGIFPIYAAITILSFFWLLFTPIDEGRAQVQKKDKVSIFRLFKDNYLLALFSMIVLIVGFEVGLMSTVAKFFKESHNLTQETANYACSLYFIARTIGTFGGAILLGKLPIRKFFITTMIVAVISFVAFLVLGNTTALFVSIFMVGLSCANVFPIIFSNALQYRPMIADEISAFMIMGVGGGALIPLLMGILADGSTQQISLLIPLFALVYILFGAIFIIKKQH